MAVTQEQVMEYDLNESGPTPQPTPSTAPEELIAVIERGLKADEAAARAWLPFGNPDEAARNHIARYDPSRVLADVESKRAILAQYESAREQARRPVSAENRMRARVEQRALEDVLRLLARPYLDQEVGR